MRVNKDTCLQLSLKTVHAGAERTQAVRCYQLLLDKTDNIIPSIFSLLWCGGCRPEKQIYIYMCVLSEGLV